MTPVIEKDLMDVYEKMFIDLPTFLSIFHALSNKTLTTLDAW